MGPMLNRRQTALMVRQGAAGLCCAASPLAVPLGEYDADHAARRFRALADPTRLRILSLLARHADHVCVCDIVGAFPLEQPTISYHLKVLRDACLVSAERRGLWAYYRVEPEGRRAVEGLEAHTTG